MRKAIFLLFLSLSSISQSRACSCESAWDDSFKKTVKEAEFVALIKILSFDDYLTEDIHGHEGKMPYSMTAEIIRKYKGREERKRIEILGDDGVECRPYLSEFEVGKYYLIAPNKIDNSDSTQYYFFICSTEYLEVNKEENIAFGKYTLLHRRIDISKFESEILKNDLSFWNLKFLTSILLIGVALLVIISMKRAHNRS